MLLEIGITIFSAILIFFILLWISGYIKVIRPRKVVKAVVMNTSNDPISILMRKEPSDLSVTFPSQLNLPGGKVKRKENLESALERIVYEETGLHLISPEKVATFAGDVKGLPPANIIVYGATKWSGKLKKGNSWITLNDITSNPDVPDVVKYIIRAVLFQRKGGESV